MNAFWPFAQNPGSAKVWNLSRMTNEMLPLIHDKRGRP